MKPVWELQTISSVSDQKNILLSFFQIEDSLDGGI